jgi:hypothetical protein
MKLTCPTSWGVLEQNVFETGSDGRGIVSDLDCHTLCKVPGRLRMV